MNLSPRGWLIGAGLFLALGIAGLVMWFSAAERTSLSGIALLLGAVGVLLAGVGWFARSRL